MGGDRQTPLRWIAAFAVVVLAGCTGAANEAPTSSAQMANPASRYCEEQGGRVVIVEDAEGGQRGMCVFPDGSRCEEWAYYRGACVPGAAPS